VEQVGKNLGGSGLNKEQILMTIKTFKKFCMKARTNKADEIHDYYIKLEELLHETLNEESEELRLKLLSKETLIKSQEEELKKLKKKKEFIYIGHTNVYNNMTKIGITEDLARRLESHKSSNPHFEYILTYNSENASVIENHIKLLLRPWKSNKAEWFSVTQDQMKILVEYYINMYDNYKIEESVDNIIKFMSGHNKSVKEKNLKTLFEQDVYQKYIDNCMIKTNDNIKTPLTVILKDFEEYYPDKKIEQGDINLFRSELIEKIENITGIKSEKINVTDVKRDVRASKAIGWVGLDLKSIYDKSVYFKYSIYEQFCKEKLELTGDERDKVVGNFLMEKFLEWSEENNINSNINGIYQTGKYSNFFQDEFIKRISDIISVKYYKNRTFRGNIGIFWSLRYDNIIDRGNNTVVYRQEKLNLQNVKRYEKLSECSKEMHIGQRVLALHLKNHKVYEREEHVYSYEVLKKYNKDDYINKVLKKVYKQNIEDLSVVKEYNSLTDCSEDLSIHVNTICKQLKLYPYYEKGNYLYSYNVVENYIERKNHPNSKYVYKYDNKDNEKIERFKSIIECSKSINVSFSTLSKHLKNSGEYKNEDFTYRLV
jgi:predicted GIY-YIG superfamily endonuclease